MIICLNSLSLKKNCGLVQVVWHGYVQAMRQAGFTGDLVLYVASGLLTYGANEGQHLPHSELVTQLSGMLHARGESWIRINRT